MSIAELYYTQQQAAQVLNVTRQTMSRWNKKGILRGEYVGRTLLFERAKIDCLICPTCGKTILPHEH